MIYGVSQVNVFLAVKDFYSCPYLVTCVTYFYAYFTIFSPGLFGPCDICHAFLAICDFSMSFSQFVTYLHVVFCFVFFGGGGAFVTYYHYGIWRQDTHDNFSDIKQQSIDQSKAKGLVDKL